MLSPKYSRLLAIKIQLAKYNKDYKMINKIEKCKNDKDVTKDILYYGVDKDN